MFPNLDYMLLDVDEDALLDDDDESAAGLSCFDYCYIYGDVEGPAFDCVSCDVCPHREECSGYDDDEE